MSSTAPKSLTTRPQVKPSSLRERNTLPSPPRLPAFQQFISPLIGRKHAHPCAGRRRKHYRIFCPLRIKRPPRSRLTLNPTRAIFRPVVIGRGSSWTDRPFERITRHSTGLLALSLPVLHSLDLFPTSYHHTCYHDDDIAAAIAAFGRATEYGLARSAREQDAQEHWKHPLIVGLKQVSTWHS